VEALKRPLAITLAAQRQVLWRESRSFISGFWIHTNNLWNAFSKGRMNLSSFAANTADEDRGLFWNPCAGRTASPAALSVKESYTLNSARKQESGAQGSLQMRRLPQAVSVTVERFSPTARFRCTNGCWRSLLSSSKKSMSAHQCIARWGDIQNRLVHVSSDTAPPSVRCRHAEN